MKTNATINFVMRLCMFQYSVDMLTTEPVRYFAKQQELNSTVRKTVLF